MDTHKKQHRVAVVYPDSGEMQEFTVKNIDKDIAKMVRQIKKRAPGLIDFCYEAGVCGFILKRQVEKLGCKCSVIAPSLVPTKPGDRIKTDRRDARKLLGQFVAGQLTEVYPPDQQQEAARELTRCRQAAQENLKRIRHQLVKFLTRHGYIYNQGRHWTKKHLDWLRSLKFDLADLEVPSEHSSGDRRRSGSITKAGNKRVRRLLIESSWHYRHRPSVSRELGLRRKDQPQWAIDIADRAMARLHRRYWQLLARGKVPNKVVVALARELSGFIWAVLNEYEDRRTRQVA
jgi:transposase